MLGFRHRLLSERRLVLVLASEHVRLETLAEWAKDHSAASALCAPILPFNNQT